VTAAQFLGEAFRSLELRRRSGRTESLDAGPRKIIDDAGDQRRFRADYDEADSLVLAEGDNRLMVGEIEVHALRELGYPRVAGGRVKLTQHGACREFPCKGMFPSA